MSSPRRLAALAIVAGCLGATALTGDTVEARQRASTDLDLGLIERVMHLVKRDYVGAVTGETLTTNALKGMLTGLDPHSDYMDEREYQELLNDTQGSYAGVGLDLTFQRDQPEVVTAIDGTPAARAGLRPGDIILEIAEEATAGMSEAQVVTRLRGAPGSMVSLMISRGGGPPFRLLIERTIIEIDSVRARLEPGGIGYGRIAVFDERTADQLLRALARLETQNGGKLQGLVIDLRDDPGGLLQAAISVAGIFLERGVVVTTRGRSAADNRTYVARGKPRLLDTPMVVLINGGSASAAEIVAGALQDHHRATVMGTRSFGKASVQTIIPLDGHGAVRLTTARYYTPAGRSIQGVGITPDLTVVPGSEEEAPATLVVREANLHGALKNGGAISGSSIKPSVAATAGGEDATIDPALIGTEHDTQLAVALRHLREGRP